MFSPWKQYQPTHVTTISFSKGRAEAQKTPFQVKEKTTFACGLVDKNGYMIG
jgi:hypothetical protein